MTDLGSGTGQTTALSGVDALVRLLLVRQQLDERDGLRTGTMVSGYPGSPLGTLDLALEEAGPTLKAHGVVHRPGLNEELAAATVWGSQMGASLPYDGVDGVVGVWYGKTPGLDRSGDVLKHGNAMGAGPNGGVVLFCGDDPSAKSSTLTCDSQYTFEDACIPVLYPADQQDIIDLGIQAFRMARVAGCWVGLKVVTSVADGNGTTTADTARFGPVEAGLELDGRPWRHQPLRTIGPHAVPDQEALVVRDRLRAAQAFARRNGIDRMLGGPTGRLGVVCAGKTSTDVLQALSDLGVARDALAEAGLRVLKLGMTYPLVEETILEFAATVDELVVIEEKRPFVETQVRSILHEARSPVPVSGKRDLAGHALAPLVGELDARTVSSILVRLLPDLAAGPTATPKKRWLPLADLPARPPAFCSGCPHNRSTVFPDDAVVGGGVGCHGIMYFEARHQGMKSLPPTPMGAEGVPWVGLAPFVSEPHLFQNIGDGTLSHSGTLAIRSCVAAGVNVTFKILYNAAVAMTGGQDVTGLMDVPALTRALDAEGVRKVVVCAEDPRHYGRRANWPRGVEVLGRDQLPAVQEKLRLVPGVTVIIYDQRCAAEARRLRRKGLLAEPPRRVVINDAVCEGCGDCSVKSNCLSVLPVQTEFGEKRAIHDPSCNRDYTCLEGDCPSFVTVTPKRARPWRTGAGARRTDAGYPLPPGELRTPSVPPVGEHGFSVYFTGIGGTGVVTASRIMESAAQASGLAVAGLDQTGLSQKAGAVVSHLRLAADKEAIASPVVGAGHADLYLSGDILQAAADRHLEKVEPGRTFAVIDTHVTPTAGMLQTDTQGPELSALEKAVSQEVGEDRTAFVDSTRIAESLFSNHLLANVILLGVAYQHGALPLASERLRDVMQRQGKAGEDNWRAFEWGRWAVQDPDAVHAALVAAENGAHGVPQGPFEPSRGRSGRLGRWSTDDGSRPCCGSSCNAEPRRSSTTRTRPEPPSSSTSSRPRRQGTTRATVGRSRQRSPRGGSSCSPTRTSTRWPGSTCRSTTTRWPVSSGSPARTR